MRPQQVGGMMGQANHACTPVDPLHAAGARVRASRPEAAVIARQHAKIPKDHRMMTTRAAATAVVAVSRRVET